MNAAMTAEAIGRLNASPRPLTGLRLVFGTASCNPYYKNAFNLFRSYLGARSAPHASNRCRD
jgi:hypothetical protein